MSFSFVTIHACDRRTDRQTDRITTPKTALAYARAVKIENAELDIGTDWTRTFIARLALERLYA